MKKEEPLTLSQLAKYTKDVLLPATQKQFIDYTTEVLLPAIDLRVGKTIDRKIINLATRNDVGLMKKEPSNFKKETNTNFDKAFDDLEMLKQEKEVGKQQDKRKKQFYRIVVNHLETGKTSPNQLQEISKLNIL